MHMTLREWGRRGCPGKFTTPKFHCWKEPSIVHPEEMLYRLIILTGDNAHPFADKYASPLHVFGSFEGLAYYLSKRPDEIEGDGAE